MITFDDIMVVIAVSVFVFVVYRSIFSYYEKNDDEWNRIHRSIWDVARKYEDK